MPNNEIALALPEPGPLALLEDDRLARVLCDRQRIENRFVREEAPPRFRSMHQRRPEGPPQGPDMLQLESRS